MNRQISVKTTLSTAAFIICSICVGLFHRIGTINAQNSMQPPVCSGKVFVSEGTTPCGANIKCNSNACQGGWFTGQTNQNNEPMLFNYCTKDNALPSNNCITYTDAQNSTFCGYHGYCKKMNNFNFSFIVEGEDPAISEYRMNLFGKTKRIVISLHLNF